MPIYLQVLLQSSIFFYELTWKKKKEMPAVTCFFWLHFEKIFNETIMTLFYAILLHKSHIESECI